MRSPIFFLSFLYLVHQADSLSCFKLSPNFVGRIRPEDYQRIRNVFNETPDLKICELLDSVTDRKTITTVFDTRPKNFPEFLSRLETTDKELHKRVMRLFRDANDLVIMNLTDRAAAYVKKSSVLLFDFVKLSASTVSKFEAEREVEKLNPSIKMLEDLKRDLDAEDLNSIVRSFPLIGREFELPTDLKRLIEETQVNTIFPIPTLNEDSYRGIEGEATEIPKTQPGDFPMKPTNETGDLSSKSTNSKMTPFFVFLNFILTTMFVVYL